MPYRFQLKISLRVLLLVFYLGNVKGQFNPDIQLKCDFSADEDAVSAYTRATTPECKDEIESVACFYKTLNSLDSSLKYKQLKGKCPLINDKRGKLAGCIDESELYLQIELNDTNKLFIDPGIYTRELCMDYCLTFFGARYATFLAKPIENEPDENTCACLQDLPAGLKKKSNKRTCFQNDNDKEYMLYNTGLLDKSETLINNAVAPNQKEVLKLYKKKFVYGDETPSRVVFFIIVSERSYERQIFRLLRTIYDKKHFYYIHIDTKSTYLRRKIEALEQIILAKGVNNVHVAKWSVDILWGGSTLLTMHLRAYKDLVAWKAGGSWDWDYIINLSESDYPLKSIDEFVLFLSQFKNQENFILFRSLEEHPIEEQVSGHSLTSHFHECDHHMFKVTERGVPLGLQFEGNTDWLVLHHTFVDYITNSKDEYVEFLRGMFNYTLIPTEFFYHTLTINSPFCTKYFNIMLRDSNFKRENFDLLRTCNCDKIMIDWCGCRPSYYKNSDWEHFKKLKDYSILFARKFDPQFNQKLLNLIDQSIYGNWPKDFKSANSYWSIYYDNIDKAPRLSYKQRFAIANFIRLSFERLFDKLRLPSLAKLRKQVETVIHEDYIRLMIEDMILKDETWTFPMLNGVYSFFQKDVFAGFTLNFEINDADGERILTFETFHAVIAQEKNEHCREIIRNVEVSTDFNLQEVKSNNFANLVEQNDNPFLLINFVSYIEQEMILAAYWFDPDDKIVKEKYNSMKSGEYKEDQYILEYFFDTKDPDVVVKPLKAGIWRVNLVIINDRFDNSRNELLYTHRFVVLPQASSTRYMLEDETAFEDMERIWSSEEICLSGIEVKAGHAEPKTEYDTCETAATWSTLYPDPKSDAAARILEEASKEEDDAGF